MDQDSFAQFAEVRWSWRSKQWKSNLSAGIKNRVLGLRVKNGLLGFSFSVNLLLICISKMWNKIKRILNLNHHRSISTSKWCAYVDWTCFSLQRTELNSACSTPCPGYEDRRGRRGTRRQRACWETACCFTARSSELPLNLVRCRKKKSRFLLVDKRSCHLLTVTDQSHYLGIV